jgi:dTDP-4-dehydrorhamnose 3,5-epimerase-like enzyme
MDKVKVISFPRFSDDEDLLCVYESGLQVPFLVRRAFSVSAKKGSIRGQHAHKRCTQLLVCLTKSIRVSWDDGTSVGSCVLDDPGAGLLVPPGFWGCQEYLEDGALLMVLCDRPYEVEDYIRDYREFKIYVQGDVR